MGPTSVLASTSTQVPIPDPSSSKSSTSREDRIVASLLQNGNVQSSAGPLINEVDRDIFSVPQPASWASLQTQPSLEMDAMGTELGNWFYENQQMLNFLDDSYNF